MRIRYGKAYGAASLCGVFGYSRQAYYERRNYLYRECLQEEVVVSLVREVRKEFPRMGTRKLLVYLEPQFSRMDLSVGRDNLLQILERNSLLIRRRRNKRKTTYSGHWMRKYPNLIREYTPTAPNQLWVAERLNGILKTEWLYHVSIDSARDMTYYIGHIVNLYNDKRPHQSIGYLTPAHVHETGVDAARKWKNYYAPKGDSVSSSYGPVRNCQAIPGLPGGNLASVKPSPDVDRNPVKNCKVFSGRDTARRREYHLHTRRYQKLPGCRNF